MNQVLSMESSIAYGALGVGVLLYAGAALRSRLMLSLAKHRSLAGHPRWAKRISALLPRYQYPKDKAFALDGAPHELVLRRQAAFTRLVQDFQTRYVRTLSQTHLAEADISDLQFTNAYRVPFQFRQIVSEGLKSGAFLQRSEGVTVIDLDGNRFYDLTGSYGVNLLGNDFYKNCIARGSALVQDLGPVLGSYHPIILENVARLKQIASMDEVSFHMSGTEAVMQAVRLARYHTQRRHVVRFCGSYHGWWGDVQPGIGNPQTARDTYTLAEMSDRSLQVLRDRRDIACVLVNPLQALHPNAAAPSDTSLLDSSRKAGFDRQAYVRWLRALRQICSERDIALIFDEVFVGFRLARGGAQEYFGVSADLVTYGKTLGGGLPIGVVCGKQRWMKRFREAAPADICFARGTFNSHPYVMGAMNEFLRQLDTEPVKVLYENLDAVWNRRMQALNLRLQDAQVPVRVANISTICTVLYLTPGCYNWLFQFYLRLQGLALSWVGTGRIIFSLNYTESDFDAVVQRFVQAAVAMREDGWWWEAPGLTNTSIKRRLTREILQHLFRPATQT